MPQNLGPHFNYETKQIYCPFFNPTTFQKQQKKPKTIQTWLFFKSLWKY
jgi:hypothetical protein